MDVLKKLIVLLFPLILFAQLRGVQELVDTIFPLIVQKKVIKVYTNFRYASMFNHAPFVIVPCDEADIVFGNENNCSKPHFVLDYTIFKRNSNAFGAFYYRKGRPQLKFKKHLLLQYFGTIPEELKEYAY